MEEEMADIEAQNEKQPEVAAIFKKANSAIALKFEDVVYKIKFTKSGFCGKTTKTEEKIILKGVTGKVLPGEMLAMLGPSGSSKTTLLTALGGKLGGLLDGNITYNGKSFSNSMKRNMGFVTQDDVLYPHLTVAETLVFTALLRLENTFTKEEKIMHAESVITQLGLTKCKNSIIGGPFLRGLSGEGNPLYFGERSQVMDYFSSIGYAPAVPMNPADFLLDLANGVSSNSEVPGTVKQNLVSAYKSNLANKLKSEVHEIDDPSQDGLNDKQVSRWATTWWQEFSVLLIRGVKERKHDSFSGLKIGQVLVVAFLSGLLWWQSDVSHLQDQMGLLFFYSGFWGIFPLFQAIFTSPKNAECSKRSDLPAWLKGSPGNFFLSLFVLLYSVLVAGGLGLAIGALVLNQRSATITGSVIMLSFLLAGGYYVTHVPAFISWVKYISFSQYTYKLLLGSQYKPGDTYTCDGAGGVCLVGDYPAIKKVGLDDQVLGAVALGIMLVGYRLIAYLALMRIGVAKR
ncbi:hypothetical protein H0E87_000426 [Populus deltoides]|uniref:ABC transporter domain-containing protein n=1 Tax=Populus deltoides TaxID=3696 RepID=A0A8T2ZM11_POPDE|nr:hypothetical protein H0E87_000426 [Populus deltoides]